MSLSKKIAAALDENTKVHDPPCEVAVEDGPNHLTLNLSALDSVGLAFTALEFAATGPDGVDARMPFVAGPNGWPDA